MFLKQADDDYEHDSIPLKTQNGLRPAGLIFIRIFYLFEEYNSSPIQSVYLLGIK